jgi:hypothetical protein
MNGSGRGPALPERHLQGVNDQLRAQVVGDRPANDPAGEHVQDDGEVDPALAAAVLGDVGDVEPIGLVGGEPPLHQILGGLCSLVAAGAAAQPTPVHALQPGTAHQPLHSLAADPDVLAESQFSVHAARTVGAVGGGVHRGDGLGQHRIRALSGRRFTAEPVVEARRRHLQDPAGRRDRDAVGGEFTDHRGNHSGRTFSRAK